MDSLIFRFAGEVGAEPQDGEGEESKKQASKEEIKIF
jgi:hypothetical protein